MNSAAQHLSFVLDTAIRERIAPAIVAAVGTRDSAAPSFLYASGKPGAGFAQRCTSNTFFDLASLTKILSTTLVTAESIALGKLSLCEQPFSHWPNVRVIDLLQHTSGLPAWDNFYQKGSGRSETIARALHAALRSASQVQTLYSDIGFIALGHLLEERLKERLDVVFDRLAVRYYGSSSMTYSIGTHPNVAGAGVCEIRHRRLRGEVNDLNAFALEGVAGHAGLFGNIHDVVNAARFFLQAYDTPSSPTAHVMRQFMKAKGARPLGFDRAQRTGTTSGALSGSAIGHLGFTGTSLWIDPETNAYFILLTNHLEKSQRKNEITQLRQDFHRVASRLL